MAERRSLLAENALTTLEEVMEFLGMDPEEEEIPEQARNNLERMINAASSYIETMTGRKFACRNYVENHFGSGSQELCLNQYPIRDVTSIIDKENGAEIAPDSYSILEEGHAGVVFREEGWAARGYPSGLAGDLTARKRYLQVSYTAGYILPREACEGQPVDLPYDLQAIVWQMVQQQWNLAVNGGGGLSAFSISDISWTFDKELGSQVQDVIYKYRRWS